MKHSFLVVAIAFLFGCMHEKTTNFEEPLAKESETRASVIPQKNDDPDGRSLKLIKKAEIRYQVDDLKKSSNEINKLIAGYPAFVANSRTSSTGSAIEHHLSIRIASEFFDEFLVRLDSQSLRVEHRNITTVVVAKEYVDVEARLRTKREVHERLKEILRNKAATIEDVLAAEREIGTIQEEIEAAMSKLHALKDKITYSTVNLQLSQLTLEQAASEPGIGSRFGDAFTSGFHGTVEVMIALVTLWPMIIAVILAIYLRKRLKKVLSPERTGTL